MKFMKGILAKTLTLLFLSVLSSSIWAADFVLKDFIDADKRISSHKPSLLLCPVTGDYIKIKDKWHQVRFFAFEIKDNKSNQNFEDFIKANNLLYLGSSVSYEGVYPSYYFYAGSDLRIAGAHFLISTRLIEDKNIISTIEKNKKNQVETKTETVNKST